MPDGNKQRKPGVGLAVSGGGFRATLFHLGALWRLNQLGYLPKLERVSSVSGGSITAGRLAVAWKQLQFVNGVANNFQELVVEKLRGFCARNIDAAAIGEGTFLPWKTVSEAVEEEYREHLLGEVRFPALPDKPRFVFDATNFATGVNFRFSKPYAGDYRIGLIHNPDFRVSLAVTASSAFPPVLSPVIVKPNPASFTKVEGADLYDQVAYREKLYLTDGGVYDNMGLEPVWDDLETVLVSDAGAPMDLSPEVDTGPLKQAVRAMDVTTNQARGLRKRYLVRDFAAGVCKGTYWGITTDINEYGLRDALPCKPERTKKLAAMRTRLNKFNEEEQCELINWGYAVCDAAMRRYVLSVAEKATAQAAGWPYPTYALNRP
jgi:NTE family protein